ILQNELESEGVSEKEIQAKIEHFRKEQKEEYLHHAQRSFIEGLVTIVNCDPDGRLRAKHIVDYWKRPEYIYLGPDENMHDSMITWIAAFSKKYGYKPGSAFISGKPDSGINHKEYGVTSLGVNVYMESVLHYLGINPRKENFRVKISGGPDGDVAGNQILNLAKFYPKTAKIVALTDVSGTIYDPEGLHLPLLVELFKQNRPLKYYPPENLSNGGFLLDKDAKRNQTPFIQQTLCWKKSQNQLIEEWLSGSEMNQLWRNNVHQVKADIFIPAGGRPRTLNEGNVEEFFDETGEPTARAIIEGANLYLTPRARRVLEKLNVLIVKDSSANKTGVICSSFEVLCGLTLGDEKFMSLKKTLVDEILKRLCQCAANEVNLLLYTHQQTGNYLTDISAKISERINLYTYEILDYLDPLPLTDDPNDPLMKCFFEYCLPFLRENYQKELLHEIPEHHKKAIIACHLGSQIVYSKGLSWSPSIVDILPVLLKSHLI
ncbi:MAG: NAD-glutamate dehydrogenase domain-containing protein, partial [Parachlamydiaceae bacterium]